MRPVEAVVVVLAVTIALTVGVFLGEHLNDPVEPAWADRPFPVVTAEPVPGYNDRRVD